MPVAKKKWIAFNSNSIVPEGVLGKDSKETKMNAHVPVQVTEVYADHVIGLKIAYKTDAPKKEKSSKAMSVDEDAAKLLASKTRVEAAKTALQELNEGTDEFEAASEALKEAEAELLSLEGAG